MLSNGNARRIIYPNGRLFTICMYIHLYIYTRHNNNIT